jgi:hypothetical protein
MTESEEVNRQRLRASIQKCKLHLKRLYYASNQISDLLPLTTGKYSAFSEAIIGNIDQ